MKTNVRKNNAKINKIGGINPILFQYQQLDIDSIVSEIFGNRPRQAKYDYDELVRYWILNQLCGIRKIEHLYKTESSFKSIPDLNERTPSHDTIGRMFKDFAVGSDTIKSTYSKKAIEKHFNINKRMNSFLLEVILKTKMLDKNNTHTLDVDTVVVPTSVEDSKYTYIKGVSGYNPIVSIIDNIPVFIEMRSGNVSPAYRILNHIKATLKELDSKGIKVGTVRIDRAGFQKKITSYLESKGIKYYIRTKDLGTKRFDKLKQLTGWKKATIKIAKGKDFKCEVINNEEIFHEHGDKCRIVTIRVKKGVTGEYMYSSVITNDFISSAKQVIWTYNQRGKEERVFDYLKNDFGWKYPPFSRMSQNTVYFLMSCVSYVFYKYIINKFSQRTSRLKPQFRLPKFIYLFVRTIAITTFDKATELIYENNFFDMQNFFF